MKRALSVLLLLCMFVSLLPGMAFAAEETVADAQAVTEAAAAEAADAAEAEAAAPEAEAAAPEAEMRVRYTGSWSSYSKDKAAAKALIEEGCVVIAQHVDTIGPVMACEETSGSRRVFHVGYNQSMIDIAPSNSLISTRVNWVPYVVGAVEAVLEGKPISVGGWRLFDKVIEVINGKPSIAEEQGHREYAFPLMMGPM